MNINTGRIKSNLSGQIFGKLTVLHIDFDKVGKERGSFYICVCDCGSKLSKSRHSLVRAKNPVKSCGCLQKEAARRLVKPNGGSDKKCWINKYKKRAEKQQVEFSLSDEEFFQLCSKDCFYCGDKPIVRSHGYKSVYGVPFLSNGLDRIKPNEGYVLENVVPCCTHCNLQKRNTSQYDFIQRAIKIAKIHNKELNNVTS